MLGCWLGQRMSAQMDRDKNKDNEILLAKMDVLNLSKRRVRMAENDSELLHTVYREISERLGMNAAMTIYEMFKGQQISFPTRFFDSSMIHQELSKSTMEPIFVCWLSSTITRKKQSDALSRQISKNNQFWRRSNVRKNYGNNRQPPYHLGGLRKSI